MINKPVEIFTALRGKRTALPLHITWIPAGFPSPADDYIDKKLDLNEYLIKHPAATFFVRVSGDSMICAGIDNSDILIVDRAVEPTHNKIIVAVLDGEFTVKRFKIKGNRVFLVPENDKYPVIEIKEGMNFEIWGVVTNVIHQVG
jgi:DNA polymerase V